MKNRFTKWLLNLFDGKHYSSRHLQISIFLLLLMPGLVVATFGFFKFYQEATQLTVAQKQAIVKLASTTLEEKFNSLTDVAISLSDRELLKDLIATNNWQGAIKNLSNIPQALPVIEKIFLTDEEGQLKAETSSEKTKNFNSDQFKHWFAGLEYQNNAILFTAHSMNHGEQRNIVGVSVPVVIDRKTAAILIIQANLSSLLGWSQQIDVGENGEIFFIDKQRHFISHDVVSNQMIPLSNRYPNFLKNINPLQPVQTIIDKATNQRYLIAQASVEKYDWVVATKQPTTWAYAVRNKNAVFILCVYVFFFLFTFLLSFYLANVLQQLQKADEDTRLLNQKLITTNKELAAFSYSLSHDLQSPLRAVNSFTQAILEDHADKFDDNAKNYFHRIMKASQRMNEILEGMSMLAKLTSSKLRHEEVKLSHIARNVITELKLQNQGHEVLIDIQDQCNVIGDKRLLTCVMENLLRNAWKFTSQKDNAFISFGVIKRATEDADLSSIYFVRDNGAGFDMRYMEKLFIPFQRLHSAEEFPGSGIGLATVKRIIDLHGGKIWAESKPDKGATFYFTVG